MFFLALFFLLPLAELMLLMEVGGLIGGWETVGVCLLTAFLGGALARRQGMEVLLRMRTSVHQGQLPAAELIDSVFIVVAGLLLMTPGFVTDTVGLLLLTPPLRAVARPALIRRFTGGSSGPFPGGYTTYGHYSDPYQSSEAESEDAWTEPEFLPPGTVTRPRSKDDPPEIIID